MKVWILYFFYVSLKTIFFSMQMKKKKLLKFVNFRFVFNRKKKKKIKNISNVFVSSQRYLHRENIVFNET